MLVRSDQLRVNWNFGCFIIDSPAKRSNGGAYDMVCCALVGLISPGLPAVFSYDQLEINI